MKRIYKTIRAILMTAIIAIASIYLLLYICLSVPFIQDRIKNKTESELSDFFKADFKIEKLELYPFNRIIAKNVILFDPQGHKSIKLEKLGGGIDIWELLIQNKLVFTHAELIGLEADINQKAKGGPLNIDYIIKAFEPKDKNRPPTKFDFKIHNIIIRKSHLRFNRLWCPRLSPGRFDPNHLDISDFKADIEIPRFKNDNFNFDIRRLSAKENSGLILKKLSGRFHVSPSLLAFKDLKIELPESSFRINDQNLKINGFRDIIQSLKITKREIELYSNINPSDLASFYPELKKINNKFIINLSASGNINKVTVSDLSISGDRDKILDISGIFRNIDSASDRNGIISKCVLDLSEKDIRFITDIIGVKSSETNKILKNIGDIALDAAIKFDKSTIRFNGKALTSVGDVNVDMRLKTDNIIDINGKVNTGNFNLGRLLERNELGLISANAAGTVSISNKDINGKIELSVPFFEFNGKRWENFTVSAYKDKSIINGDIIVKDTDADLEGNCSILLTGSLPESKAELTLNDINLKPLKLRGILADASLSGNINANITGIKTDDITGELNIKSAKFKKNSKILDIGDIYVSMEDLDSLRIGKINSRFCDVTLKGDMRFSDVSRTLYKLCHYTAPSLFPSKENKVKGSFITMDAIIKNDNTLSDFFNLPFKLLTDIPVSGYITSGENTSLNLTMDCPYIQQGKTKLIKNSGIRLNADDISGMNLKVFSLIPVKHGEMNLNMESKILNNNASSSIYWFFPESRSSFGNLTMSTILNDFKTSNTTVYVNPSTFNIKDTVWNIEPASITIDKSWGSIKADSIFIHNKNQLLNINGSISNNYNDTLTLRLKNINLDYIFNTLNINYVTFGGEATGIVKATNLLSRTPRAYTDALHVRNLTYNGGRLGDADISSNWNPKHRSVDIFADIFDSGIKVADVDGAVFLANDSLGFNLDANKVNIKFLQPFMEAFTSDVEGRASGNASLFGTFSDIDLIGRLFADSIRMKIDYTNTYYGGSDSVLITPGHISIPKFRLYDEYGHAAILKGNVRHRYFHEPSFDFKISDAKNFLCYNTNPQINPDWYGTIFGNGGVTITGYPGVVNVLVEMATAPHSIFTLVLNDIESANDYTFLSFTDKRKEFIKQFQPDTIPEIEKRFRKKIETDNIGDPSSFNLDLRATVTPAAQMLIIMDPVAGDRISARGSGALQIGYEYPSDRISMYGKYILDQGIYNFSLQDIILKNFTIRPGSAISFNGNPYNALLDIDAVYRLNTNLADLDQSFETDKDLNRTSVPVDAVLKVSGELNTPDIDFDIELPTLSQDIERKVKSIISTEDMMNRQMVYLLALNRFYSPDYMGYTSEGNEFASLASTTLSTQISSMLSKLTGNWHISPYLRSDNGDFSDFEMDFNLYSSFLNNRLFIRGNLGYRDRATSSTTFIGDFDLEYLLNRHGLRLKAYNRYNDHNYYLKSSLTTQGVGIMYKHDFDRWFSFLRRKKKNVTPSSTINN